MKFIGKINMKTVPIEQWGKDHWSTFAYMMACVTTKGGKIDQRKMRCDPELHFGLAHLFERECHPTRLRDGSELHNHDDWSCLEDIEEYKLLSHIGTGINPGIVSALEPAWPIAKWMWEQEKNGKRWSDVPLSLIEHLIKTSCIS